MSNQPQDPKHHHGADEPTDPPDQEGDQEETGPDSPTEGGKLDDPPDVTHREPPPAP